MIFSGNVFVFTKLGWSFPEITFNLLSLFCHLKSVTSYINSTATVCTSPFLFDDVNLLVGLP